MKLSHPYTLKLTGDPDDFLKSPRNRKALAYLLERLFSGEEVAESEFAAWGIKIELVDEFVKIERAE